MSVLSKILLQDYSMCYNCYELGHTWTPSCSRAALGLGWCTFSEAIKMYTALYAFNQIVSKRTDTEATVNSLRSIIQSSLFLGFNAYAVIIIFCMTRRVMGKFYYILAAHIPAIIGSYLAIQVERPSRRSALSFYVANVAGETVFNKMLHKGWFPVIPMGEVALFAASTAGLLYLMHRNGFGNDPVSFAFRFLLGSEFAGDRHSTGSRRRQSDKRASSNSMSANNKQTGKISDSKDQDLGSGVESVTTATSEGKEARDGEDVVKRVCEQQAEQSEICGRSNGPLPATINEQITRKDRTAFISADYLINDQAIINFACPHPKPLGSCAVATSSSALSRGADSAEALRSATPTTLPSLWSLLWTPSLHSSSCTRYAAHAFVRNFVIAFTGQTVASLLMRPHLLIRDPVHVMRKTLFQDKRSLKLGLFVASFAALFKGSSCLMRSACRQHPELAKRMSIDDKMLTLVAGLIAGSSMLFSPSSTAAQYMLWKLIETVYFDAVRNGRVKYAGLTMDLLYAVSTAQLFYVAVMEPKMMRQSYTKWLNRVTKNSFGLLNRNILNVFGTESSFGYTIPDHIDLDLNHCSDKFKESVLVWMI